MLLLSRTIDIIKPRDKFNEVYEKIVDYLIVLAKGG